MVAWLYLISAVSLASAMFGVFELLATLREGATVFQQISARVDVGLSLLVSVTASGFAALLQRADAQALAMGALRQPVVAKPREPLPADAPVQWQARGESHGMHRDIPFEKQGDEYVAVVAGTEVRAHSPDLLRTRINKALAQHETP